MILRIWKNSFQISILLLDQYHLLTWLRKIDDESLILHWWHQQMRLKWQYLSQLKNFQLIHLTLLSEYMKKLLVDQMHEDLLKLFMQIHLYLWYEIIITKLVLHSDMISLCGRIMLYLRSVQLRFVDEMENI